MSRRKEEKEVYCLCRRAYDPNEFMIECDVCKEWFHGSCVGIEEHQAVDIESYHCPNCQPEHGPLTLKRRRNWHRHDYTESNDDRKAVQTGTSVFVSKLKKAHFYSADEVVVRLHGSDVTVDFFEQHGFNTPLLVEHKEGLGLKVPPPTFTIADVERCVGPLREIDVIDVSRQGDLHMKMMEWTEYYTSKPRRKVLNVISLEFSDTELNKLVTPPTVVREMDWIEAHWPKDLPDDLQHLKNGDILTVAKLPALAAEDVCIKIVAEGEERKTAIAQLVDLSRDYVFALEFISQTGVPKLMTIVELSQLSSEPDVQMLTSLLEAFQELMQHNVVSWEALTENFVKKLINFIDRSNQPEYFQASIVSMCLEILQSIIGNSPKFYKLVSGEISIAAVVPFLDKQDTNVKCSTLAFINAMISKADAKEKVIRNVHQLGKAMRDSILSKFPSGAVPRDIAQELYIYQCHLMNQYESRMNQKFVAGDAHMEEDLHHLPARAFQDEYVNKSNIALTKVLCQIFRVGEPPIERAHEFIPVVVIHDEPLKEIFCVTIQLLFKTWREMRASVLDLEKVMVVVTKQILTVLQFGTVLSSTDTLKLKLFEVTYKKIVEVEENNQLLDESVLKSKPVQELSEAIRPEIIEVKQERLRHLVEGATFPKIGRRGRDQLFCCRLSPNYKMLHFGDITGEQVPPLEALDKKIPVSEMKLEVGAACPHADKKRAGGNQNIFSIFYDENEHLDFVAPNETVFNIWVDGFSVLVNRKMTSKSAEEDIEMLLNMDLKIQLLDLDNILIPTHPPTIPPEPSNYVFL
eukprot:Em0001g114a